MAMSSTGWHPGENYVPMHAYRFNRDTIDNLILTSGASGTVGGELSRPDRNLPMKVDFSDMVDPAFLDAEVECIGQLRSSN